MYLINSDTLWKYLNKQCFHDIKKNTYTTTVLKIKS